MSYRENEIRFTVTQCNNGYVLETSVEYNFKRQVDIEDGKSIHSNTDEVVAQIKKLLTSVSNENSGPFTVF